MNCNCNTGEIQKDISFHYWLLVFWIISTLAILSFGIGRNKGQIDKLIKMHQTTTTAQVKVGNQ